MEICAERYDNLEQRMVRVEDKIGKLEEHIIDVKETIQKGLSQSTAQAQLAASQAETGMSKTLIVIGTAVISALIGGVFTLIVHVK